MIQKEKCEGVNFVLDVRGLSFCQTMDTSSESPEDQAPLSQSVIYSAQVYCLSSPLEATRCSPWSFERFPGRSLQSSASSLALATEQLPLEECLELCLSRFLPSLSLSLQSELSLGVPFSGVEGVCDDLDQSPLRLQSSSVLRRRRLHGPL